MELCPTCVSSVVIKSPQKLKTLKYIIKSSNINNVMDLYYKKTNRPNLYAELGNDSFYTATDRFSDDAYNKKISDIQNISLIDSPYEDD